MAQTGVGAFALVRVYFGSQSVQDGLATALTIDGDRLRFDFVDAWLSCSRTFRFDLIRQP